MKKKKNKVGKPLKYTSVEDMKKDIDRYFEECEENGLPLTVTGLAMALKMDRQTLINYSKKEEYFGTIKEARLKIENFLEINLYNNNVTGTIFNLKNNFGWKDKQEVEHSGSIDVESTVLKGL